MPAAIDDLVTPSPLIISRTMESGAILMNTANGECFELNRLGATVWDAVGRGLRLDQVVDDIVRTCDVDVATASADVLRLIDGLAQQGIVSVARR